MGHVSAEVHAKARVSRRSVTQTTHRTTCSPHPAAPFFLAPVPGRRPYRSAAIQPMSEDLGDMLETVTNAADAGSEMLDVLRKMEKMEKTVDGMQKQIDDNANGKNKKGKKSMLSCSSILSCPYNYTGSTATWDDNCAIPLGAPCICIPMCGIFLKPCTKCPGGKAVLAPFTVPFCVLHPRLCELPCCGGCCKCGGCCMDCPPACCNNCPPTCCTACLGCKTVGWECPCLHCTLMCCPACCPSFCCKDEEVTEEKKIVRKVGKKVEIDANGGTSTVESDMTNPVAEEDSAAVPEELDVELPDMLRDD